ncbi:MAG: CotH kinase family protein, partial [Lachnospiraceae bacterium]|nr:CotH kinase family protein [Lachnospiraceae bacterium]
MNRKYIACLYAGVLFAAVICVTVISHVLEKSRTAESETEAEAASVLAAVNTNNTTAGEISADGTGATTDGQSSDAGTDNAAGSQSSDTGADSHILANEDSLHFNVAGLEISLWPKNGQYYAFLPSACREAGLEPELPENIDPDSVVFLYSEHIPAVFIETESGTSDQINSNKNIKEPGTIKVLEPDGSFSLEHSLEYIKGRGNTSYTEFDKKPYQIKLTQDAPFLDMEPGKKWVFVSNSADSSLIRNALSRSLAGHLNLPQSEEGTFVDLYVNKEYVGNYYVVEKIEIQENRLLLSDLQKATEHENETEDLSTYETAWTDTTKAKQIPNDPEDITGGYLIERDFDNRFLKEVEINESYFITEAKECFIVRDPEYTSEAQIAYIDSYVQSVENAILSAEGIDGTTGKSYQDLIDVDSFVRKYLLEEVTANYDGGVASSYFYKDSDTIDGRLYAGPVWDYDVSWGNSPAYLGQISTSPERLSRLASHSDSSVWFQSLYHKPEVYEKIVSCYAQEISPYLTLLADEILPMLDEITAASAAMDQVRWEEQYARNGYSGDRSEQITFITDYIKARKDFLDQAWIAQIPVHTVTLLIEGAVYDTLYVLDNDTLPEFPQVPAEHANVVAWTSAEDGSLPDHTIP